MFTKTIYVIAYFRRDEMAQRQSSKCRRCTQNSTDGEALIDFDKKNPVFAKDLRNVRLQLASDGLIHLEI